MFVTGLLQSSVNSAEVVGSILHTPGMFCVAQQIFGSSGAQQIFRSSGLDPGFWIFWIFEYFSFVTKGNISIIF
jgi:hypothetical protein